jgi:transcriptional regulator with XRE-family HTH domain
MNTHELFAENLRRKVAEHGTIADVCRGIGVNRQQFNKYIAGTAIPNAMTLRKICHFLNILEHQLFLERDGIDENPLTNSVMPRRGPLGFFQFAANKFDFEVNDLQLGYYECIMPLVEVPGMIVSSLLLVQQNGRQKEFVRLTRTSMSTRSSNMVVRGRHKGVVFANSSEIYFIGVNRFPPHQVSFMAIKRPGGVAIGFNKGTILTHGLNGPVSTKVCTFYAQKQDDLKGYLRGIGVQHIANRILEPFVADYLLS